ncbi:MAG TPA: DEAD/DEAH box helicase, partial [Rugosibacter sp.]
MAERREKKAAGSAGNTLAGRLARLGLRCDIDLVLHLPLRYEDETRITAVSDALPGVAAQFEVEVVSCEIVFRPRRQLVVRVQDDSGALILRFLNFYPSQQKVLQPGVRLRVFGELRDSFLGDEMIHPRFHAVPNSVASSGANADVKHAALPAGLTPVYPTTAGLGQAILRRLISRALARSNLADTLPADVLAKLALPSFSDAVRLLHSPPPECFLEQLESRHHPAWRRVQFDELLAQQLSLRRAYTARRALGAPQLAANGTLTQPLLAALPFRLTGAQQRAGHEIANDLTQPHPMQRLLQGDVGSGKTIVAALAMLHAVEAGYQAALMAPTEILAEQHYRKLSVWLAP